MEMSNIKRVYGFVVETRNPSDGATLSILSQAPAKASQWRYVFRQSMLQSLQIGWRRLHHFARDETTAMPDPGPIFDSQWIARAKKQCNTIPPQKRRAGSRSRLQ